MYKFEVVDGLGAICCEGVGKIEHIRNWCKEIATHRGLNFQAACENGFKIILEFNGKTYLVYLEDLDDFVRTFRQVEEKISKLEKYIIERF